MSGREVRGVGQFLIGKPALGPQEVERTVRNDPMQPGPERATVVEPPQRGECALEPVGGHIVCERAPTGDGEGSAPRVAPVAAEQSSCGFAVAASGLPHEVSVTRFTHSSAVWYERAAPARPGSRNTSCMTAWQEQDDALVREFELPSFPAAIDFVDRLAELAESENHHPDIDIRYRRVTVRWTTHSEGGVTAKDREMAERTSALASA